MHANHDDFSHIIWSKSLTCLFHHIDCMVVITAIVIHLSIYSTHGDLPELDWKIKSSLSVFFCARNRATLPESVITVWN